MNTDEKLNELKEKGWTLVQDVYPEEMIRHVRHGFERVRDEFVKIQEKKGIARQTENATHHTIVLCREMLELLEETEVNHILKAFFQGKYILNTMGLSLVPPDGSVYTQKIHRDVRTFTGELKLWVNTLIMLDDSTPDNGATWILEGSHKQDSKPDETHFFENAVRVTGRRGDVMIFDGNIWHAAGINRTGSPRYIITPIYSRPYIKQQLDYPRAFGPDFGRAVSPHLRQILGYNALTPVTLDEFYQKDDERFYKSDQG